MKTFIAAWLAVALVLVAQATHAAPLQDGPYVSIGNEGAWVARWVEGDRVREEPTGAGKSVTVPAVGELPAFSVTLREPAGAQPDEIALRKNVPLFVIADTHGELEIAAELLKRHRIIDSQLRWAFGRGHLAVLGDVFDRGPNQTEILWLLYKLEAEAARAGGGVHIVLGNHEAMVLGSDERYLNAKYVEVQKALGAPSYSALWSADTLLGHWLRARPAVLRIGNFLCLHGGISREILDRKLSLAQINAEVRAGLGERKSDALVFGKAGPLWYRGYFPEIARKDGYTVATADDVEAVLAAFGVKRIFVGHTVVDSVRPLFEGRVIAVQVYPHRDEASGKPVMEGLLVRRGQLYRARIDGTLESL